MKVIEPSAETMFPVNGVEMMKRIEEIGRVCYKSEGKITDTSYETFIANLIDRGHESVIEHITITAKVICDRGVSHEIVRHRLASYSQESTRFCNYSDGKFGSEITIIKPCFWVEDSRQYNLWLKSMEYAEEMYKKLIDSGATPQEARSVLPNSLKTEIVMTMNLREWRHFFKLRTAPAAHPQMRQVALVLLEQFMETFPIIFKDFSI